MIKNKIFSSRFISLIFVISISLFILIGCSSDTADNQVTGDNNEAKNHLNIALSAAVSSLDFQASANTYDAHVTRQIMETLLKRDPETMEFKPGLATEWEQIDELTWQFKLREGVKFHNGEPFNAEAVKFSIERNFDPSFNSPHASSIDAIERVEVVDEYTVNIVTKEPFPLLLTRNTMAITGTIVMVPPKYIEENGNDYFNEHPIGTGPYKFKEWAKGEYVTLTANSDYWGGAPEIEEVTFTFIPEASTRVSALLAGDVDIIQGVPTDMVEKINNSSDTEAVISESGGTVVSMKINPDAHPALKDKKVRQALNYAVDINTILDTVLSGYAKALPVPADPLSFGYHPNLDIYPYDPEKAKQLLAEAGYGDGFSLDAYTFEERYPGDRAIADAFAAQLADVGVNVNLSTMEGGKLLDLIINKEGGPLYQLGFTYTEFDVTKLYTNFHPEAPFGTFEYNDFKEFADLVDEAEREMDPDKRQELWWQAQEVLLEEAPYIHAWQPFTIFGARNNIDFNPNSELFDVNEIKFK